jgi:hypothetical protein
MELLMSLQHHIRKLKPRNESTVNHVEKVQKLYVKETYKQAAYDMEKVIVSAAGGPDFESEHIPNSKEVGEKIISSLKLTGTGSMPKNIYPATSRWAEYFKPGKPKGSTLTPKTDFFIGDRKISLKTGDAQLMSGEKKEASATFYVAAEESGTSLDSAVKNLEKHINNLLPNTDMRKLGIKGNKTDLKAAGKFAEVEILKKADDAHHAFKNDLRKAFSDNPAFAQAFTFEAMTGMEKFGNNEGTADHFLVTDFKGNASIHKVTSSSDSYVKKISKQVNPDVKFKSTQSTESQLKSPTNPKGKTGYYTFWSTVGIGVKMVVEEEMKNGDLLNEGVFDIFKRALSKAVNWIKNFFKKVKKKISESWQAFIAFMAVEPEVNFNNNISWK